MDFSLSDCAVGTQSPTNLSGCLVGLATWPFLSQNRLAFAVYVRIDGESKPADCKALMSDFVCNSLVEFYYLQLADTSRLSAAKPYRGFESLFLRHTVLSCTEFRSLCAEIRE